MIALNENEFKGLTIMSLPLSLIRNKNWSVFWSVNHNLQELDENRVFDVVELLNVYLSNVRV